MLQEGDKAPDFELNDTHGNPVKFSDFRGRKVVLYFYPKDNTPGCTVEACEFRDEASAYDEREAVVLGVSPDGQQAHEKFSAKFNLPFALLSDTEKSVATSYGVWGEKKRYGRTYMGIHRTTFLIDADGRIAKVFRNVRPKGHSQQVLEAIGG